MKENGSNLNCWRYTGLDVCAACDFLFGYKRTYTSRRLADKNNPHENHFESNSAAFVLSVNRQ